MSVNVRSISISATRAVANELVRTHAVATVPGVAFGLNGWMRASYAKSEEVVHAGFERIATALFASPCELRKA